MADAANEAARLDGLDAALLDAHAAGDGARLSILYGEAADALHQAGDTDAAAFYRTQAFIFALEAGSPDAARHAIILREAGRL